MRNIWAVTMHTLTEAHSRKISLPFLVAALLGVLVIIGGFGIFLTPNQSANDIISGFFWFWSWGTILTALCLGAASIPIERQSETLFTLPIHRWELLAGKLLGNWILVTVMHILGYVISVALAFHSHLPVTVYSIVALLTAIAASFGFLCLSVPLGMRLSAVEAGTMTVLVLYSLFVAVFWVSFNYLDYTVQRFEAMDPMSHAFFNRPVVLQHYLGIALNLSEGLVFLSLFGFLFRRTETIGRVR